MLSPYIAMLSPYIVMLSPYIVMNVISMYRNILFFLSSAIISHVQKGSSPRFRPKVSDEVGDPEYHAMMKQCWEEYPQDRQRFEDIAKTLKKLNGGKYVVTYTVLFYMVIPSPYIVIPSPYIVIPSPYIVIPSPYMVIPSPYIVIPSPYMVIPSPYIVIPSPYIGPKITLPTLSNKYPP